MFSYFLHFVLESLCSFPLDAPDPGCQWCMRWFELVRSEPAEARPISAASLSPVKSCIADIQCVDSLIFFISDKMYYYLIRVPEKFLILGVFLYAAMLCGGLYLTLNWFLSDHVKSIK